MAEFSFAMVTPKGPEGFGCPAGRANSKESFPCFPLHILFLWLVSGILEDFMKPQGCLVPKMV